ncbi:unnamed protein product [Acanthoscelides obtectus]|nr:unnamed protein product [Acanthoscelides obtectus]CAK1678007.1 tRNA (uracil-5-)-methyltransferase homolog A [Acanthoscelides obtectus]
MENAILVIKNYVWRKKVLSAQKSARPQKISESHKRTIDMVDDNDEGNGRSDVDDDNDNDEDEDGGPKKMQRMDPKLSDTDKLRNAFIPLWKKEYKDQLAMKQMQAWRIFKEVANELKKVNPTLTEWIEQQKNLHDDMPCELLDVRHGNNPTGYRNHCVFNIGLDPKTEQASVGFKLNTYINGFKAIAQPDGLMHIPEKIIVAVKAFQDMLRTRMNRQDLRYPAEIIIRSSRDQLLLLINQYPRSRPQEDRERFEKITIDYFSNGPGKSSGVTSLYTKREGKRVQNYYLWGERLFYEYPLDLTIKIFPDGFYPTNSEAAQIFYKTALEFVGPVTNSTVIDLCCGLGTLGLCFAKNCKLVLGVDTVKMCTQYAIENAGKNKIKNASFYTGKAQDLAGQMYNKALGDDVVVVCDPPRSGLHEKAIFHIRNSPKIKKILYVSINPKSGLNVYKNLAKAQSKKVHGDPFVPTKAVPLDMNPHTNVTHIISLWERWSIVKNRNQQPVNVDKCSQIDLT